MSDPLAPVVASVRPVPDPAVLAAIAAAVDQLWPRPVLAAAARPATPPWRFSGRWWAKPTAARRARPWVGGST
ncbi:MAG: hypothetical protein ACYDD4_06020 [Acidimicrobiales bacterium]